MTEATATLIDRDAIAALFGDLDPDTHAMLLKAAHADITEWSERLIEAWQAGEMDAVQRARHSLKGLCGNFGATALLALCETTLHDAAAAAALRHCRDLTLVQMSGAAQH